MEEKEISREQDNTDWTIKIQQKLLIPTLISLVIGGIIIIILATQYTSEFSGDIAGTYWFLMYVGIVIVLVPAIIYGLFLTINTYKMYFKIISHMFKENKK